MLPKAVGSRVARLPELESIGHDCEFNSRRTGFFLPNHDETLAAPPRTVGRAAFVVFGRYDRSLPHSELAWDLLRRLSFQHERPRPPYRAVRGQHQTGDIHAET